MSTASEPAGEIRESREPPSWLGDVADGVAAWTRASSSAQPAARPATAPPPEDTAVRVPEADPESVARKILLDALTGRARSRHELEALLAKKGVPSDISEQLLDRFTEVGLVDDEAFAQAWVAGRHQSRGLAPRALALELRRKGIDDDVARDALDQLDDEGLEETARSIVRRKLRSVAGLDAQKATRRLVGMLARKGYPSALAFRVVREELQVEFEGPDLDV